MLSKNYRVHLRGRKIIPWKPLDISTTSAEEVFLNARVPL